MKRDRECGRETPGSLAPFFICFFFFFFPSLGLPSKIGLARSLVVLPEVLTLVLGLSFVLFSWAFPFLVF